MVVLIGFLSTSPSQRLSAAEDLLAFVSAKGSSAAAATALEADRTVPYLILRTALLHRFAASAVLFPVLSQCILSPAPDVYPADSEEGEADETEPFVGSLPHSLALLTSHRMYAQAVALLYASLRYVRSQASATF